MAYSMDLSDSESNIKSQIHEAFNEYFPEIDITENSAYDDLIVSPVAKLLNNTYAKINTMGSVKSIDELVDLEPEELDEYIEGNYFLTRIRGNKASTILTLSFTGLEIANRNSDLVIPAGIIFANTNGYQYQTTNKTVIYKDQIYRYLNKDTSKYDIDVYVEALLTGKEFNTDYNTITVVQTKFNYNLVYVKNLSAVTNGSSTETNQEYINRTKRFYYTRTLNTPEGYKDLALLSDPNIKDVTVQGYGDKYMTRDIIPLNVTGVTTYETSEIIVTKDANLIPKKARIYAAPGVLSSSNLTKKDGYYHVFIIGNEVIDYKFSGTGKFGTESGKSYLEIPLQDADGTTANPALHYDGTWKKAIFSTDSDKHFIHLGGKIDIGIRGGVSSLHETTVPYHSPFLVYPKKTGVSGTVSIKYLQNGTYVTLPGATATIIQAGTASRPSVFNGDLFVGDYLVDLSLASHVTNSSTTVSGGSVSVDGEDFSEAVDKIIGTYIYTYDGTNWKDSGAETISLEDYGITLTGTPSENDTITVILLSLLSLIPTNVENQIKVSQTNNNDVYYTIRNSSALLDIPMTDHALTSLYSDVAGELLSGLTIGTDYSLSISGEKDTSNEVVTLNIYNASTNKIKIPNTGSLSQVYVDGSYDLIAKYKVFDGISSLATVVNINEARNVCADVMIIPCKKANIILKIGVRANERSAKYKSLIKDNIRKSVLNYFNEYELGTGLDYSSLVGYLYADGDVYPYVSYISTNFNGNSVNRYYITKNSQGGVFETYAELSVATTFYYAGMQRTPVNNDYCMVRADESKSIYTAHTGYASFTSTSQYVGYYVSTGTNVYTLVTLINKDSLSITAGTTIAYDRADPTTKYVFNGTYGQQGAGWQYSNIVSNISLTDSQLDSLNGSVNARKYYIYDADSINYIRPEKDSDGVPANTGSLPIYDNEYPVLNEDNFDVIFE